MSATMIRQVEHKIVRRLVRDILATGRRLSVSYERGYDLDEMLHGSTDQKAIMEAAFAGDECHLFVQSADGPLVKNGVVISEGWVYLVFGNDGWDVISDYTTSLEPLMAGANKLSDHYA